MNADLKYSKCWIKAFFGKLMEKYMPCTLKKDARKLLNQSWGIPNAVFVMNIVLQGQFSFCSKFSRSIGSMLKMSTNVLLTKESIWPGPSRKAMQSAAGIQLMANQVMHFWPEVCVFVSQYKSQPFTMGVGLQQGYALSSLLFVVYYEVDRQSQPSQQQCHCWITSCRTAICFLQKIWCCLHPPSRLFSHHLNQFSALCKQVWINLALRPRYYVYPEIHGSVQNK